MGKQPSFSLLYELSKHFLDEFTFKIASFKSCLIWRGVHFVIHGPFRVEREDKASSVSEAFNESAVSFGFSVKSTRCL